MSLFKVYDVPVERLLNLEYCNSIIELGTDIEVRALPAIDLLTTSAYQYFNRYTLNKNLLVFYTKSKKTKNYIHVDRLTKGDIHIGKFHPYSLNCIIKGQGTMQWFAPKEPGILTHHDVGFQADVWPLSMSGQLIDTWNTGKISLVQTNVPHRAFNDDLEDRVCVSIRWKNMLIPWEKLVSSLDTDLQLI